MPPFQRRGPRCFISLVAFFLTFSTSCLATDNSRVLEAILQKIESRHYRWVAIRAEVLLFFAVSGDSRAMCGGELLYQRLDERMLLPCVDSEKNLVFVFRTFDDRFDLYLPSQKTVYHGSIFDMEDSPDIESHLKPRDLYRALKPLAFDPEHTVIERHDTVGTTLNVYRDQEGGKSVTRRLYLTSEGDVLGEIYYDADERPLTQVQRYDFQEIPAKVGLFRSIFFPKKITILSPLTRKGSAIFFTNVKALDATSPLDFVLRVPQGTKEIFLKERTPQSSDLSFQPAGKKTGEETGPQGALSTASNDLADADFAAQESPKNPEPEAPLTPEPELTEPSEPEGPAVQSPESPDMTPLEETVPSESTGSENGVPPEPPVRDATVEGTSKGGLTAGET